jgi:putative oxidoreductase
MKLTSLIQRFNAAANWLQSPVLLLVRLIWGWQFMVGGWGKLQHLDNITEFFSGLGIPFPHLNAILAGSAECFGGALLLIGLGARFAAVPLIFTMVVAYATADRESLLALFSDSEKFFGATPLPFLVASLLILAFGPGTISVDKLISRFAHKTNAEAIPPSLADGKTTH